MCPWVGPHASSFVQHLWGLPSRVEYLSPQRVLLPLVYGMTASPLWLELWGLSAWQATPSWTVYWLNCHRLLPWLRVTFAMGPDAAWPGSDERSWGTATAAGPVGRLGCPSAPDPWVLVLSRPSDAVHVCEVSWTTWLLLPVCPLGALCCMCGVLGHLAPVHRGARSVRCIPCAVSWATWLLLTGVPARCVVLRVWCPGPLGSCSPVCPLGVLCGVCGVLGSGVSVHRCARSVCCVAFAVSWATSLLFTGVPAQCVVLRVRCPGPLGSCSVVCAHGVFCVLCVRCPGPLGSCSPLYPLGALSCVCGVHGHLAPAHQCIRTLWSVACPVSWATWLLFTGVPAWCVELCVRCPGPLGSRSPVYSHFVVCRVSGVLGHLAPVHWCARSVRCVACAVSSATWLLFTSVPAWSVCCVCGALGSCLLFTGVLAECVVLRVQCSPPLGSCSWLCPLRAMCCVCGVLGNVAAVHRCARSMRCVLCAMSLATWLLFTGVHTRLVVLRVRCPAPLGSCSPLCTLGVWWSVGGVPGHLAPVHRCACSACGVACVASWASCLAICGLLPRSVALCVACAVSWATWLLFNGVPAWCGALRLRCPGALASCSPVCSPGALCCVCSVLSHLAPVDRRARSVRCVACALSWATWLLFTGVPARCVVFRVRCPGPLGSCSPVCTLGLLCCVCGVLGHLAPVHRCGRLACCVVCAVYWATWLLLTLVHARCMVSRGRCPWPLGSCSPVCLLSVWCCVCGVFDLLARVQRSGPSVCSAVCCVCGVLGHFPPVHRCAGSVRCVTCAVSWATWLLFTGVPALCVVLPVRCPGPLGSCSSVCPLGGVCCVCGALDPLPTVRRSATWVHCVGCAVSWATSLLFTGVPARCDVLCVRCPGPPGSSSPVCSLGASRSVCGVLGKLAAVHRCAHWACCVACAVCWATWLLFTGVHAWRVVLCVRCPGPLGTCSPVCLLGAVCCVCGALGPFPPVRRCPRSVCCVACAVSWATWLLFTGLPVWQNLLHVRRPWQLGSCSPMCPVAAMCCVCGVLGHLAPVHRCPHSVRCVPCALSWATWLLFTGLHTRLVLLRVRCTGPLGSCSTVCTLGVLCFVCCVLGHLAAVHPCARLVCGVAWAVWWATWLLFTGELARRVVLRARRPRPLDSRTAVCSLGVLRCVSFAVSWATWLLFTGVPARCVALLVQCPGPLGSCSPVCLLGVLLCLRGDLGHLAPAQRCPRSVCCVARAVSWASWLLFTGVPARCGVLRVRCPGPLASCSPVCSLVRCVACEVSWAT